MVYTLSLEIQRKNITPNEKKWVGNDDGKRNQSSRARNNDMIGVKRKGNRFEREGLDCSLLKSFRASARG